MCKNMRQIIRRSVSNSKCKLFDIRISSKLRDVIRHLLVKKVVKQYNSIQFCNRTNTMSYKSHNKLSLWRPFPRERQVIHHLCTGQSRQIDSINKCAVMHFVHRVLTYSNTGVSAEHFLLYRKNWTLEQPTV